MRRRILVLVISLLLGACTGGADEPAAADRSVPPPPPSMAATVDEDPLPAAAWSARAEAPLALTEVTAAPFGGQIWVAGGYAENGRPVADVQVYDPASDTWSQGPPLPQPLHHTALVATGDRLFVLGGYTTPDFAAPTDAVHVLDPATGEWQEAPSLPEPRGAGAAAYDGERVVYGGGVGLDGGVAADVIALGGAAWEPVGELQSPREHLAAASDGAGTVWLLGGRRGDAGNLAEVDLVVGDEVARGAALPTPRGGISGFHAPGAGGCAAGGESGEGTFVEVECVSTDGEVTTLPDLAEPRHGIGAVTLDGNAYVLLGGPEPGLTVSDTTQALHLP